MVDQTRDVVNSVVLDVRDRIGFARLGLMNNQVWHEDPRRLLFTISRYKFVSKMLSGCRNVLEVGCGDGFCARVVKQEVERLTISDFDPYSSGISKSGGTPPGPSRLKPLTCSKRHWPVTTMPLIHLTCSNISRPNRRTASFAT